uniref:Large ribosomal subunit protein uL4c n=1 Tax=Dichotomaria marginata TaxID=268567 RepID=A0A1G4NSF1_9FLOR|nr:Ribosomal protein L4 [Dichotomaria marginata]SCW21593.1 Ribosomal protein L4 [Dichotomaria marginata]
MTINKTFIEYKINSPNLTTPKNLLISLRVNNNSMYLIHRAFINQITNNRQRSANTKTRSEIRGGGKKPWKQKGTGKARAGSIRSPLWRGGGVIFGPKPKDNRKKINQKEKKIAINSLLVNKKPITLAVDNNVFTIKEPKTKLLSQKLKSLNLDINQKILIITESNNHNLYLATRNLSNVKLFKADQINIACLLKAEKIIITENSLLTIAEVYNV